MAPECTASAACTVFVQRELTGELVVVMGIDIQDARAVAAVECASASLDGEWVTRVIGAADMYLQLHGYLIRSGVPIDVAKGLAFNGHGALVGVAQVGQGLGDGRFDGSHGMIFDR